MNGAAGIGVREGDEEGEVVCGIGDCKYVFLEGGVGMEFAGAHAEDYGAVGWGFEDGAEDSVLRALRCGLRC